jgi:hypothetical protein
MADTRNALFYNWPFIKELRYVVRRRANYLHTGIVGLLVGLPSDKGGQNEW